MPDNVDILLWTLMLNLSQFTASPVVTGCVESVQAGGTKALPFGNVWSVMASSHGFGWGLNQH